MLRLPRRRGETIPTWLERIVRRREWKSRAEVKAHGAVAEPARHDDLALGDGRVQRELQPLLRSAGLDHEVALQRRIVGVRVGHAEALAHLRPSSGRRRRRRRRRPGCRAARRATAQPIMPAPTTVIAIADEGCGIPQHVHRRLDRSGQHGTAGGDALRDDGDRRLGHHEGGLMREEGEHGTSPEAGVAALDDADVQVAVLDRSGEVALLERRAHPLVLARGHLASEDERLGAPADARVQRPDQHLAGCGIGHLLRAKHSRRRACQPRTPSPGSSWIRPRLNLRARRNTCHEWYPWGKNGSHCAKGSPRSALVGCRRRSPGSP